MPISRWIAALALLAVPSVRADIVVIVNTENSVRHLTVQQVSDLYLGRSRVFPGGEYALVFDLARDAPLRERFITALTGMSMQQINAYWARLMFTGQVLPPQQLPDEKAVLEIVKRNAGAIGYVRAEAVDGSVHAVLTLKQ